MRVSHGPRDMSAGTDLTGMNLQEIFALSKATDIERAALYASLGISLRYDYLGLHHPAAGDGGHLRPRRTGRGDRRRSRAPGRGAWVLTCSADVDRELRLDQDGHRRGPTRRAEDGLHGRAKPSGRDVVHRAEHASHRAHLAVTRWWRPSSARSPGRRS